MIRINGAVKKYKKHVVLDLEELTLGKNKIYGIVGPNGSGKTTLLKAMLGLCQLNKGLVTIDEKQVKESPTSQISYMGEKNNLTNLSIKENIEMHKTFYGDIDDTILNEIITLLPINLHSKPDEISKGQLAIVRLALCISRKTPIYILDEPFDGLDVIVRRKVIEYILKYIEFEEKMVVLTSHQLEIVEPLLDEVIVLNNGKIVDQLNLEVLREEKNQSLMDYFEERFSYLYEGGRKA